MKTVAEEFLKVLSDRAKAAREEATEATEAAEHYEELTAVLTRCIDIEKEATEATRVPGEGSPRRRA